MGSSEKDSGTLPRRFHTAVVRGAYLEQTDRHGRCPREPYVLPTVGGSGLPRWSRDDNHPPGALLVEEAGARAGGPHHPVRDLF
ncbi:hypothetical protein ACGFW5_24695 [Streptomyces sp. NPDC048416]|uniref:hypothetical protein n=1 Tax=Streptomyces sp. NPDC048416 TaxID=3365546 RepID=UPI00371391D4